MRRVVVTGTIAYDHIMNLGSRFKDYIMPDKIHMLNVSFQANEMRKEMGGTGGNIAYGLGMLGGKPVLLSTAGEDFDSYALRLKDVGVDCSQVKVYQGELCSSGFCITDHDDNQIWSFSFNASKHIVDLNLDESSDTFVVISPTGPQGVNHFVDLCIKQNMDYMYDPAFAVPELSDDDLSKGIKGAKIVIGNDYEVELMKRKTGMTDEEIVKDKRILIITLGSKGSKILYENEKNKLTTVVVPVADPESVSDPTGAGDAFRAGFLAGYLRGLDLEVCGKMGSLSSVYTVEKYGTTTHKFTLEEFSNRFKSNFGQDLDIGN